MGPYNRANFNTLSCRRSKKGSGLSLITSTLIGVLAAFAKEKEGLIYELTELEMFLNYKNIFVIDLKDKDFSDENLKIFNHLILSNLNQQTIFYYIEDINKDNLELASNFIKKHFKSKKFSISNKISEVLAYDNLILILQLGKTRKNNIIDTINKFKNYKKHIKGIIVLKS